jgi:hypothetical protein
MLDAYRSKMSMQEMYDELFLRVDEVVIEDLLDKSIRKSLPEKSLVD